MIWLLILLLASANAAFINVGTTDVPIRVDNKFCTTVGCTIPISSAQTIVKYNASYGSAKNNNFLDWGVPIVRISNIIITDKRGTNFTINAEIINGTISIVIPAEAQFPAVASFSFNRLTTPTIPSNVEFRTGKVVYKKNGKEFGWDFLQETKPQRKYNKARFNDGTELEFNKGIIKETLVIPTNPMRTEITAFRVIYPDEYVLEVSDGNIVMREATGWSTEDIVIMKPTLVDAKGNNAPISLRVNDTMVYVDTTMTWLNSATYPITYDPILVDSNAANFDLGTKVNTASSTDTWNTTGLMLYAPTYYKDSGLVSMYNFDGGTEDIVGNNPITVTGGVLRNTTDGVFGSQSYVFNASTALTITMGAFPEFPEGVNTNGTLAAWVKPKKKPNDYETFVSVGDRSSAPSIFALVFNNSGNVGFSLGGAGMTRLTDRPYYRQDIWVHFVGTKTAGYVDGNTTLYVNGTAMASSGGTNVSYFSAPTTCTSEIGSWLETTEYPLNASIDMVMIFNRTLNATEVSNLYNGGELYKKFGYFTSRNFTLSSSEYVMFVAITANNLNSSNYISDIKLISSNGTILDNLTSVLNVSGTYKLITNNFTNSFVRTKGETIRYNITLISDSVTSPIVNYIGVYYRDNLVWNDTIDFDTGIKEISEGNYRVVTSTDENITSGQLQLMSWMSDKFSCVDADGDTQKWDLGGKRGDGSTIANAGTSNSDINITSNGGLYMAANRISTTSTRYLNNPVVFTGAFDVAIKIDGTLLGTQNVHYAQFSAFGNSTAFIQASMAYESGVKRYYYYVANGGSNNITIIAETDRIAWIRLSRAANNDVSAYYDLNNSNTPLTWNWTQINVTQQGFNNDIRFNILQSASSTISSSNSSYYDFIIITGTPKIATTKYANSGTYTTENYTLPLTERVSAVTLRCVDCDDDNKITKIEFLDVTNAVIANCTYDVTVNNPVTLTSTNCSTLSNTYDKQLKSKIYFVGNGTASAALDYLVIVPEIIGSEGNYNRTSNSIQVTSQWNNKNITASYKYRYIGQKTTGILDLLLDNVPILMALGLLAIVGGWVFLR